MCVPKPPMFHVKRWLLSFVIAVILFPLLAQRATRLPADEVQAASHPQRPDCVYHGKTNGVKCLPSFIIAGTQKSGTTVLAALLSDHSDIVFSRKKEAHFFDKTEAIHTASYLKLFPAWDYKTITERKPIYGEATPYYIASRNSCRKIAQLLPNVKMIILLREPTSRANSEYNMKRRRVAQQDDFLREVEQAKSRLHWCMQRHPLNYTAIQQCVPASLAKHDRWVKLQGAWKRSVEKNTRWGSVIDSCFPNMIETVDPSVAPWRPPLFIHRNITTKTKLRLKPKITFNATSCWQHYKGGLEAIKSLREAMVDEMSEFQLCRFNVSTGKLGADTSELDRLDRLDRAVDRCLRVSGGISTQYFYRSMYAVQLHHCFKYISKEQFLIIPSGRLRRDTVAVYAEVLSFLGLQPEQAKQAQQASSGVTSPNPYGAGEDGVLWGTCDAEERESRACQRTLDRNAVEKHFPSFARSTGWSIQSAYAPLPKDIQQQMQGFFAEQNELLFELLGWRLESDW